MPPPAANTPLDQVLAARADAARARLRREQPELGTNRLTVAEVLALPEDRLAELVAIDHFGWRLVNHANHIYETPPTERGVAYSTRPFHPCTRADDDQFSLRFVRKRHRHLLVSLAMAMLDLAQARTAGSVGADIHPVMVAVLAPTGDFSRALLLIASTTWQADQARRWRAQTTPDLQHKEPDHGLAIDQPNRPAMNAAPNQPEETPHEVTTTSPSLPAAPARAEAAVSPSVGAGAATPAPHASSPQTLGDSHGLPTPTV